MARELHYNKETDKYALWSTVIDDYITMWSDKAEIEQLWVQDKVREIRALVHKYMEEADIVFETTQEADEYRNNFCWEEGF